ncbi:MAG: hypothetical protein GX425_12635 [Peptococcaceae bacterium]|nr:hypothetical protein [Peptococcaceae bacterium]
MNKGFSRKRFLFLHIIIRVCALILFINGISLLNPEIAKADISVLVHGNKLVTDTEPVIISGRTLVPLRAIFEALGATVQWDGKTKTIAAIKENISIILQIDNRTAQVNNLTIELDTPATILNSRTMVPVRFIAESLGEKVSWNEQTQTVIVGGTTEVSPDTNSKTDLKLMPPTNIKATLLSNGFIELKWDASTGATGYKIYKKSKSINSPYKEDGKTKETLYEAGGQSLSDYWFKIKAVNDTQESDFSEEVMITTGDPPNMETSLTSPAPVGQHFILYKKSNLSVGAEYKIDIALVGLLSGNSAWEKVINADSSNSPPSQNEKYIIATFRIDVLEPKNMSFPIYTSDFDLFNKDGFPYDPSNIGSAKGVAHYYEINKHTVEGVIDFLVRKTDSPVVVFDKGESSEVWFRLYQ